MSRPRPIQWLGEHPTAADVLYAATLTVFSVIGTLVTGTDPGIRPTDALAIVLAVAMAVPVALRRSRPFGAITVSLAAIFVYDARAYTGTPGSLAALVIIYSIAAYVQPRRRAFIAGIISGVAVGAFLILGIIVNAHGASFWSFVGNNVMIATAFILGDNMHRRRQRVADLEERARTLEHTRELETTQAVTDERARIARELHDVVAHTVSVMVVQAGAARRMLDRDPERAATAMAQVETTGREALTEMRRLLGVLRTPEAEPSLAPQPGLAALSNLVEADPNLAVVTEVHGDRRDLEAIVDLSAFRIIQEALTNVRKHAGVGTADVSLWYGPEAVQINVTDHGRGAATAWQEVGDGHGLLGMRERAAIVGGTVVAGPRIGGGWQVVAHLPYHHDDGLVR